MSSEQPTVRDYLQRAKTSLAEAIADLPAVSRGILGVSVAAYIINFFSNILYDRFSLDASAIVNGWQVYRLFTYTFTNPFLLSLIINMVVLLSVSSRMERALGTLPMAWVLLVTFTVLPGLLFVAVASLLDAIIGTSFSNLGMCGFDPVIFASIVLLSSQEGTGSFRLFGSYSIQAVYFPWLLFVVCALFSSFSFVLLNGAGMAIGYLYVRGKLDLITPSPDFFLRAETETRVGRWVAMNTHNFIGVDAATGLQSTLSGWLPVWSADVSDAQERGAASSPLSSPPAYQTGSSSHSTSEGTAREPLFPGQGHKLGA